MKSLLLVCFMLFGGKHARAQYVAATVETGRYYCAVTRDQQNNIYLVRYNSVATKYEVVKYVNGDPANVVSIYANLSFSGTEFPWGIAVNANGDVFVTNPNSANQWEIVKLAHNAGVYTPSVIQTGKYYSALAVDADNNLLAMEYSAGPPTQYRLMRYPAGQEHLAGTQIYNGLTYTAGSTVTFPWGIITDAQKNIYLLDMWENNGGRVIKLPYPAYAPATPVTTGRSFSSIAIDGKGDIYTIEGIVGGDGSTSHVMKYKDLTQPGRELFTGLSNVILGYPWGLTVNSSGSEIYVNDGSAPGNGRFLKLAPKPVEVAATSRLDGNPSKANSVRFSVVFTGEPEGVAVSTFALTTAGITGAGITHVAPAEASGNSYEVTVATGTGDGTIRLDVNGAGIINPLVNFPYTSGAVYTIDRTAPTGTLQINNGAATTNNTAVTLQLTGTDAAMPLEMAFSNNGGAFSPFEPFAATKSWMVPGGEGVKTVGMQLRDAAGNVSTATISGNIMLDLTPPVTGPVAAPASPTGSTSATFTFSADDPAATFEASLDGGAFTVVSNPVTFNGLHGGNHSLAVRAKDAAGNVDATPETASWTIIIANPGVSSVGVPGPGYYTAGQPLAFTVNFNSNVVVSTTGGIPYLGVTVGSAMKRAVYTSGTGTSTLTFAYTVEAGDIDMDGITLAPQISMNGAAIQGTSGNSVQPALANVGVTTGVLVNAAQPAVTLSTTAGPVVNNRFTVTITFSEAVTGFTPGDFNAVNANVSNLATADNITFTVVVTPVAEGAVSLFVPAGEAENVAGNKNTVSNTLLFTYDATMPRVTSVVVPASGHYAASRYLDFTLNFDEHVVVTGTPSLGLIVGASTRQAAYVSGSGTSSISFRYVIQEGDLDMDGITLDNHITLNGGTVRDVAANNANLALTNAGSTAGIRIDGVTPEISMVSVPAGGYYRTGQALKFTVHFSEPVILDQTNGAPSLEVNLESGSVAAVYDNHTSNTISFQYVVVAGDEDLSGITLGSNLLLRGSAVRDAVGNDAQPALRGVGNTSGVFVYTVVPTVQLSGTPPLNTPFTMTVVFSEAVTGLSVGDFNVLNTTVSDLQTTDNITYTVLFTPDRERTVNIQLPAGIAFNKAGAGNTASNIVTYTYDITAPKVVSVVVPPDGFYKAGDVMHFQANFDENVVINTSGGTPYLDVRIGATTRQAWYTGGSGTRALAFSYTVQRGEQDADGIVPGAAIVANGATFRDAATNEAVLALKNVGNTDAVFVDAVAPVVNSVSVPDNGYYKTGNQLGFTVMFSKPVVVGGQPYIDLLLGDATVRAYYTAGSGTNALVFRYQVRADDKDLDGIATGSVIVANGGSLKDAAGNEALPTLQNVGSTSHVFVYSSTPVVTLLTDNLLVNAPFPLTIVFSEAVTGFDATDVTVTNAVISNLQTADNTTYTVLVTPAAEGHVSLKVPANAAFNIANTGNTPSNVISYYFDDTAPVVSSVTVPANGYYTTGDILTFTVNYPEVVKAGVWAGAPTLNINVGGSIREAAYMGGAGTSALAFSYTIREGDMDMDGIAIAHALNMNGSVFRDASGNTALTALNNIGSTAAVFVNTAKPSVSVSITTPARVNAPFTATLLFSEAVTGLTANGVTIHNGTAGNLQTANNSTYTLLITPSADGPVSVQVPADAAVNTGRNGNTASNKVSVNYDGTAPVITPGQAFATSQNSVAGTVIGKVTATEAAGSLQQWVISNDASGGAFAINDAGDISVKDAVVLAAYAGRTVPLTITVSDGLNTSAAVSVSVTVNFVNKAPAFNVIPDAAVCASTARHAIQVEGATAIEPDQSFAFTVSSSQPYFDALSVDAAGLISYQLKGTVTSGEATVTVTIKDNGGTANGGVDAFSRSFTITVNSLPAISISSNKGGTISKGDAVLLSASGAATYSWAAADGIISGRRQAVLEARPMATAIYQVTGTTAEGCSSTGNMQITVMEDFKVDATNILTPNGDGRNDKWVIRNIGSYPDNDLKIYDRAGRMVYARRNYNNEWDGTVNGNPLGEGTYYYILIINGGAKTAKGYITIVRDRH